MSLKPEYYGFQNRRGSIDSGGYEIPSQYATYQEHSPIDPAYQVPESPYGFFDKKQNSYGYAVANIFPQKNEIYAGFSHS